MEFMSVSAKFVKNFTLDKLQQSFVLDGLDMPPNSMEGNDKIWKGN